MGGNKIKYSSPFRGGNIIPRNRDIITMKYRNNNNDTTTETVPLTDDE